MDWLRSCYTVPMVFNETIGPVLVDWYWCDEDAKCFPVPHAFGSQNWWQKKMAAPIGEQAGPRNWRDGSKPDNGSDGQALDSCLGGADESWWIEGIPDDEETGPYDDDCVPVCCNEVCVAPDTLTISLGGCSCVTDVTGVMTKIEDNLWFGQITETVGCENTSPINVWLRRHDFDEPDEWMNYEMKAEWGSYGVIDWMQVFSDGSCDPFSVRLDMVSWPSPGDFCQTVNIFAHQP